MINVCTENICIVGDNTGFVALHSLGGRGGGGKVVTGGRGCKRGGALEKYLADGVPS